MSAKHTPGPWRFEKYRGGDGRDGYGIISEDPATGPGYGVAWIEQAQLPRESDGHLFAAAPELYEAAKALQDLMMNHADGFRIETKDIAVDLAASSMIDKFKGAIAKAEGRK